MPHRRAALSLAVQDAAETDDPEGGASQQARLSFPRLYDALARDLTNDRSVLLLYALLYGCQPFQVLCRPRPVLLRMSDAFGRLLCASFARSAASQLTATPATSACVRADAHVCHVNAQTYAMVRSDLDTLLMPLLRQLYDATRRAPSHMYMLLVIVLILSQDAAFAAAVHKVSFQPGDIWPTLLGGLAHTHCFQYFCAEGLRCCTHKSIPGIRS